MICPVGERRRPAAIAVLVADRAEWVAAAAGDDQISHEPRSIRRLGGRTAPYHLLGHAV